MGVGASQWGLHLPLFSSQLWGQQTGPLPAQPPIIDLLSPHEGVSPCIQSQHSGWDPLGDREEATPASSSSVLSTREQVVHGTRAPSHAFIH